MLGPLRSLASSVTAVAILPPTLSPATARRDEFTFMVWPFSATHFVAAYACSRGTGYLASGEGI
jgi:hypothetical protein